MIIDPDYAKFEPNVRMMGGNVISVPLKEDGDRFCFDLSNLEGRLTNKTRMIMFSNPGNPTGLVYSKRNLYAISDFAAKHNIMILCDEMYRTMVFDQVEFTSLLSISQLDLTVIVNGFSKAYDMTGFRVGYFAATPELISRMLPPFWYSASACDSISQVAALAAWPGPQDHVRKARVAYQRKRAFTIKILREIKGLTCTIPQAATFAFPKVTGLDMNSQQAAEFFLKKAKVSVIPGYIFGRTGEGYIRLSYTNPKDEVTLMGLENMRLAVDQYWQSRIR